MEPNSIMKNSEEFKRLNRQCSRKSYIRDNLHNNDREGFSSAGILIIDDYGYDLVSEERDGTIALSIPGGKRDYIGESPFTTAAREYKEETGKTPPKADDVTNIVWYGPGKYALYIIDDSDTLPVIPTNTHPFSKILIETYSSLRL